MGFIRSGSSPSGESVGRKEAKGKASKKKIIVIVIIVIALICLAGSGNGKENPASNESGTVSADASSTVKIEAVDKSALNAAIEKAAALDQSAYTPASYASVNEARTAAQQVADNEDATKADVDKAKNALNSALGKLEEAFDPATYQSVSYSDVARNPDDYTGKKLVFTGRVLQVVEGKGTNNLRIATDGKYDDIVLVAYDPSIMSSRILEDDTVTVYGKCIGLQSYKSTLGKQISIPGINAVQIEVS